MAINIQSLSLSGLTPTLIDIEISYSRGQPQLIFIGLPNRIINEAKERISSALEFHGIRLRAKKTIVNLAPADLKKTDSYYELPIAVGLLKLQGLIQILPEKCAFFGEFSLTGDLKPLHNAIPLLQGALKSGFKNVVIPEANFHEAQLISNLRIFPIKNIGQILESDFFRLKARVKKIDSGLAGDSLAKKPSDEILIPSIDAVAVRAMSIAVSGAHNLLLVGPPGVGKSALIEAVRQLLPPSTISEHLESLTIYSLAGKSFPVNQMLRPVRSPHHSSSITSLIGGGTMIRPGEISLAHNGVLFLDEITEFSRQVLDSLREPMVQHHLTINRNSGQVTFPALSIIVAACNPCRCGFYQSNQICKCTPLQIQQYRSKVSGPLADRFDLQVYLTDAESNQNQTFISATAINKAYQLQQKRYTPKSGLVATNGKISPGKFRNNSQMQPEAEKFLNFSAHKLRLSLRNYSQISRIARTIADLSDSTEIKKEHIAEALQYRCRW